MSEKDDTIRHEISAAERLRFEEMLLRQDTATALRVAVGYAMKRTKSKVMARHLANDAFTLVWERCSWDPEKGPALPVLLCGIIRSELNHEKESGETREEHEQESLADPGTSPDVIPTPEALVLAVEEKHEDDVAAAADQEWLRSAFEKAGDEVNLLWLKLALEGVPHDDPAAMAKAARRDVNDFYRAQERRKRHLKRMLTLDRGRRDDEEENG